MAYMVQQHMGNWYIVFSFFIASRNDCIARDLRGRWNVIEGAPIRRVIVAARGSEGLREGWLILHVGLTHGVSTA